MDKKYSYLSFFQNLYRSMELKYKFHSSSSEEFTEWKQSFREELVRTMGLDRLQEIEESSAVSHEPVLTGSKQMDGYIRQRFVMETLPEVYMPFYVLIPGTDENTTVKRKAVIAIPAHGANKETVAGNKENTPAREKLSRTPKEAYGLELVRQGYLVFCPDPPGYGERQEPMLYEDSYFNPEQKQNPLDSSCRLLSITAEAFGLSLMGLMVWDLMRLLDYICSREDVDSEAVGCVGFSGGGEYTMWLAALDDRIRAAVISGYVHSYYDSLMDVHLCPCNYAPNLWKLGDISDVCSLIAPRPLFVENGIHDPESGRRGIVSPTEEADRIRDAYRLLGEEDNFCFVTQEGEHEWFGTCYPFLKKKL